MNPPEKWRVAAAFSNASHGYEGAATVQRLVAGRLARELVATMRHPPGAVLEIGCGTGLLTRPLLRGIGGGEWLVTDLSAAMVEQCRRGIGDPRVRFRPMDGETPDVAPGSVDLVVSSMAFQWFADLPAALGRLVGCLTPGGRLEFATLGADTFTEWRAAHATLGLPCGVRRFPDAKTLGDGWPPGGIGRVAEERMIVRYADGRAFLRALKEIGAGVPAPGYQPLAAGAFRRLLSVFASGCDATYHILYGSFTRDSR